MSCYVRSSALSVLAFLALASSASANASAPRSPVTRTMSGTPCSVTARFTLSQSTRTMSYGGSVSCAGGVGQKTVDVVPQVFNVVNGKPLWFDISLIGRYAGPTPINPLRMSASAPYVPSHTYRLLVYGRVTLPSGRTASMTVCSGSCAGSPSLGIRASHTYYAAPASSKPVADLPCSVGQDGLLFTLVNGTYVINYGGVTACRGTARHAKTTLAVCVQVVNRIAGRDVWFTVSGSCLSNRPSSAGVASLRTARSGFLGHGYRIVASATIRYQTGHGTITRSARAYSAASAP